MCILCVCVYLKRKLPAGNVLLFIIILLWGLWSGSGLVLLHYPHTSCLHWNTDGWVRPSGPHVMETVHQTLPYDEATLVLRQLSLMSLRVSSPPKLAQSFQWCINALKMYYNLHLSQTWVTPTSSYKNSFVCVICNDSVSTSSACSWDARAPGATEAATWTFSAVRVHNCSGFGCDAFTPELKDCGWTSGTTFHTGHTSIHQSSLPFTVLDYLDVVSYCSSESGLCAYFGFIGTYLDHRHPFNTPKLGIGGNWPLLMYELIYNPGTHSIVCKTSCVYILTLKGGEKSEQPSVGCEQLRDWPRPLGLVSDKLPRKCWFKTGRGVSVITTWVRGALVIFLRYQLLRPQQTCTYTSSVLL